MKKLIIALTFVSALFITSCDQDNVQFEGNAVGLAASTATRQVTVPTSGRTIELPAIVTNISTESRTFGLEFVGDAPAAGGVTLGSITVPANSYDGTASISFDFNSINLEDGVTETFAVKASSADTDVFGNTVEIEYFKAIVCNDATLTINTDFFAEETGLTITNDATGAIVYQLNVGDLSQGVQTVTADIFLDDGCYTAVIVDSPYADGQDDGTFAPSGINTIGNYTITCSILTFVGDGGGQFGGMQTRNFCVNQ